MSYLSGDSLLVRIRIAFGADLTADPDTWPWTDVTDWWHVPTEVVYGWGRSSADAQPETSTLSLTLKNGDGRFTSGYPLSPYWPYIVKWVPITFDIDLGDGFGWRNRFSGFVRRWPVEWPGPSSQGATAPIEAVGVLGRIGRGKPPARSPWRRTIPASGALAYWPGEDGLTAGSVASAYSGHPPMTVTGTVAFVANDQLNYEGSSPMLYGTSSLVDLAGGGSLTVAVPATVTAATTTVATLHVAARVDLSFANADVVLLEWTTSGTYSRWQLVWVRSTFHTQVIAYNSAGTATTVIDRDSVSTSFGMKYVSLTQNGGNIDVSYDGLNTGSIAGTLGGITSLAVNPTRSTITGEEFPVGHIAIWAASSPPYEDDIYLDVYGEPVQGARASYFFEAADQRLARLAAEDGISLDGVTITGDGATRMGWQPVTTAPELYGECERTDLGLIYESGFGLGYLPRAARYNQAPALVIDAAAGQLGLPFAPVNDDQVLRTVWTVERDQGSSAVAADQVAIAQHGEIESSVKVSLYSDAPLADQAWWRLHLSTVQEARYPQISIPLSARRELAAAWCECRPGSRVQVLNPPRPSPPGVVDQVIVGATERYRGRRGWRVEMVTAPARPWDVATAGGLQRVPADGSTLAAELAEGAMTLSLASTLANGVWGTDTTDFPLDIRVGGERITLSAITGTSSPQTATIAARAVNGITRWWPVGTPVDVWDPAIIPL